MKNEIILESKLTQHQKHHVTLVIGIPVIFVLGMLLTEHFDSYGLAHISIILPKLLFLLSILSLGVFSLFLKVALLNINNDLYRAVYIFGMVLLKKKIDLSSKSKVAVLKLKKRQKMAWFSVASPDQSLLYYKNDITLLNEKHTEKELLVSLDDEDLAIKAVNFLEENFNLTFETYSPDFS